VVSLLILAAPVTTPIAQSITLWSTWDTVATAILEWIIGSVKRISEFVFLNLLTSNNYVHCNSVRNSWSAGWGNQGYIWIQKGTKMCGVEDYVYGVSAQ